jgi:hypothetical protein
MMLINLNILLQNVFHVGSFYSLGVYFEWKTMNLNSYKLFILIA